jgi:hypothetical protein
VLFLVFFSLLWCCSSPLLPLLVNQTLPPFLFLACVANGFFHGGLELLSAFPHVL